MKSYNVVLDDRVASLPCGLSLGGATMGAASIGGATMGGATMDWSFRYLKSGYSLFENFNLFFQLF